MIYYFSPGMRILSFATAVFDYAATATTQLSLVKGDRVMVLSKTGQDKGWWKGEHCDSGAVCCPLLNHMSCVASKALILITPPTCLKDSVKREYS